MVAVQAAAKRRFRWSKIMPVVVIAALVWGVWAFAGLTDVPENQVAAEGQLERPLLFYEVWDGTPYVVFEYGGVVHFDHLILDMSSMSWPPSPRWQWSGEWDSLDASSEPASVGIARLEDSLAIFGQINDPEITRIDVLFDFGGWQEFAVTEPGYAVQVNSGLDLLWINWLDDAGHVVYSQSYF